MKHSNEDMVPELEVTFYEFIPLHSTKKIKMPEWNSRQFSKIFLLTSMQLTLPKSFQKLVLRQLAFPDILDLINQSHGHTSPTAPKNRETMPWIVSLLTKADIFNGSFLLKSSPFVFVVLLTNTKLKNAMHSKKEEGELFQKTSKTITPDSNQ